MKPKEENTPVAGTPYVLGRSYFIRTITNYFTGRLIAVYNNELVITSAAWIPDCGRLADFLNKGTPTECEPFPDAAEVIISKSSVIDCVPFVHPLPGVQK